MKKIEVVDKVHNRIYRIDPKEEVLFHPMRRDYPIVIKDVLKEQGLPDSKLRKVGIVFREDGETLICYDKKKSNNDRKKVIKK